MCRSLWNAYDPGCVADWVIFSNRSEKEWGPGPEGPSQQDGGGGGGGGSGGTIIESNWEEVVDNFDDMNLKEDLLRGIYGYGFEKPSAIQQRAIIPCIKRHDVIAQAQSGTGKTATFSISILQQIDTSMRETQALVLAPTRELAQQVCRSSWSYVTLVQMFYNALTCGGTHHAITLDPYAFW